MTYCYFIASSRVIIFMATLCDYRFACVGSIVILPLRRIARLASVLILMSVLVLALLSSIRRVHIPYFDVAFVLWLEVCA
jgi:hypothetical protein